MRTSLRHCARIASLLAAAATNTFAATSVSWDGSNTNWTSAIDWLPAVVPNNGAPPGATYSVIINAGQATLDISPTISALVLSGGTLNDNTGNSLTVLGSTGISAGTLQFGSGAHGSFATIDNVGSFTTGYFAPGNNTVSTSGTFTNESGANTYIFGSGDVANFNAFNNNGRLEIALGATVNLTGGGNGFTDIPQNSLLQVAGTFNVINSGVPSFALAHLATIEGDLLFANAASTDTSALSITNTGALELIGNQTFAAPAINNSGAVNLGYFAPGNNTLAVSGTFTNNAGAALRLNGSGDTLNVGSFTNAGSVSISSTETLNITGGGNGMTDVVQGSTYSIAGAFNVVNSSVASSALGHLATIEGDLLLANHAITDASNLSISSTGAIELTGNQTFSVPNINDSGAVNLGYFAAGNNTLTVTGALAINTNAVLRIAGTGDTVNVGSISNAGTVSISSTETLNITGGGNGITDVAQGSTYTIGGVFNVTNGNVTASAFGHLATIEGDLRLGTGTPITDASNISVSSAGSLELIGNQTFSVPNINDSGAVNLGFFAAGNNILTVTGALAINTNAVLRIAGTGDTVNVGSISNAGTVSISSTETLNITGGGNGITDVAQGSTYSIAGAFNVINSGVASSALGHLATIEGDLRLGTGTPITDASNISVSSAGSLELNGNQTFSVPNINDSGSVNLGFFATGNNTLNVTGALAINTNAVLRIAGTGDTVNVGSISNAGTVSISSTETLNITGGGNGITTVVAGSTIFLGGNINVINNNVSSNGLANLASVAGVLELLNGQTLTVGNVSVASTGQLFLGSASTLIAGNITNSGFVASSSFTSPGNSLTITGTFTNNAGATLDIQSGDTTTLPTLNNSGTVNVALNYTMPNLTGGKAVVSLGNFTLTLNGGSSQNTLHDNNAFGTSASLISNGNVQTGPLQLANVTINGHHTIALPGSRILNLTLQGSTGNWTSGLNLAPFAKTIIEDSANHNATLARTLDQVNFGLTHANGIYSSALAPNQRLVVIDNASVTTPFGSFGGQPADAGSILLMPTYLGDANLDSAVDLSDLSIVLNNFGSTNSSWLGGNFDGAATIDLTDLSDVLNNFGSNGGTGPNIADLQTVSTPEPASLALFAFGLAVTLKVRR